MAIHAIPNTVEQWVEQLLAKEKAGDIPLPIVDWIRVHKDAPPTVVLVAPGRVRDADEISVDVEAMALEDRLALDALLDALASYTDSRPLRGVYHLGGLDYSFCAENEREITLKSLPLEEQPHIWGLLYAITSLGWKHPDIEASTPKMARRH